MKLLKKLHQGFLIIRLALFPVFKIPFFLFKSPSKFNSLKFEISILYAFLLGLILVIFSGVFYIILFYALNSELDNELKVKAQEINQSIRAYLDIQGNDLPGLMFAAQKTITGEGKDPKQWWNRMNERRWARRVRQLDFSGKYINFTSAAGESLIASRNLHQPLLSLFLKEIPSPRSKKISLKNMTYDHHRIRLVNFPFIYTTGPRYFIQVGSLQKPATQLLQNWLYSIAISIPLILILTSFVGRLFAARILEPVQKITAMAQKITYEDLSSRVQADYFDSEMKGLVEAFNDMISRLEQSFKHIEEFSSHVAHELKTPLAIIRGESELALRKDRDIHEYKRVININLQESARMVKTIGDLLLLAKLDYQPEIFKFESVDFIEFFKEIYEQSQIFASEKNITVHLSIPRETIKINADQLHLRRLFFNLIDNALKFTPQHGRMDIVIKSEHKKVVTAISDTGKGIAPEALPKIFERFFRAGHQEPGNGLGLSIAQSIAWIHKGEIQVTSQLKEGTTFKVILPASFLF